MEGLIFFIAMIVFIVKTVNKIKKAAGGSKKNGKLKSGKPAVAMDKLEKLIHSMEEADRLKKEGEKGEEAASFSSAPFMPEKGTADSEKRFVKRNYREGTEEESFAYEGRNQKDSFSAKAYSRNDFFREEFLEKEEYGPDNGLKEEYSAGEILEKETDSSALSDKIQDNSEIKSETVYSGGEKRGILSSLSKYPELQRAVILKEIFDSPLSGR